MNTKKIIEVPTGHIIIARGDLADIEFLSLADYGKEINVKCDCLGLTRNIEKVEHTKLLPLTEKWVITISTQYGCSMRCKFCDVPKVGKGINATYDDLINQIKTAMSLHPEIKESARLNIHYARMGEPSFNSKNVIASALWLKQEFGYRYNTHPVVSTIMPKNNKELKLFIENWIAYKNITCQGNAGLQLSINSTCEDERAEMFSGNCLTLKEISEHINTPPKGRKYTLNFALSGYQIEPDILLKHFNPDWFLIKITPMHKTKTAEDNNIKTEGDYTTFYPYQDTEEKLKKAGYDVLVFIASEAEDTIGRITCGNAILSDNK